MKKIQLYLAISFKLVLLADWPKDRPTHRPTDRPNNQTTKQMNNRRTGLRMTDWLSYRSSLEGQKQPCLREMSCQHVLCSVKEIKSQYLDQILLVVWRKREDSGFLKVPVVGCFSLAKKNKTVNLIWFPDSVQTQPISYPYKGH